ncbi:hypothetical protein [Paraburkholderia monticola]|uniref:hypothetical protein n=1 Tax=Paraburkholderia monticola TaxID=1399968 RepID=UPI00129071D4|nr:hypothetical protein [Paraburkholderia monticola]
MMLDTFQPQRHLPVMPVPPAASREVVLRHLQGPSEISEVQHLRREIDLAVHERLNPYFHAEEKKETK